MAVRFFSQEVDYHLKNPRKTKAWIIQTAKKEKHIAKAVNIVFCSDSFLLKLNKQFLHHQTLTDILTFDYSDTPNSITAEIYISVDRVRENARKFATTLDNELHRVIIHGILHLVGYKDKKASEKAEMREKEEAYLSLR